MNAKTNTTPMENDMYRERERERRRKAGDKWGKKPFKFIPLQFLGFKFSFFIFYYLFTCCCCCLTVSGVNGTFASRKNNKIYYL